MVHPSGMGHAYERELRGVLTGDRDTIGKMTRTGGAEIIRSYSAPLKAPFMVVRAAGSLGTGDLVVLRSGFSFVLEVKAAGRDTVHFSESSGKLQEQAEELGRVAERAGILAMYAFRLKGHRKTDPWCMFTLPNDNLEGRGRLLARYTPDLPTTDSDTFVLRWNEGRPLHHFLEQYYEVFEDGLPEAETLAPTT